MFVPWRSGYCSRVPELRLAKRWSTNCTWLDFLHRRIHTRSSFNPKITYSADDTNCAVKIFCTFPHFANAFHKIRVNCFDWLVEWSRGRPTLFSLLGFFCVFILNQQSCCMEPCVIIRGLCTLEKPRVVVQKNLKRTNKLRLARAVNLNFTSIFHNDYY